MSNKLTLPVLFTASLIVMSTSALYEAEARQIGLYGHINNVIGPVDGEANVPPSPVIRPTPSNTFFMTYGLSGYNVVNGEVGARSRDIFSQPDDNYQYMTHLTGDNITAANRPAINTSLPSNDGNYYNLYLSGSAGRNVSGQITTDINDGGRNATIVTVQGRHSLGDVKVRGARNGIDAKVEANASFLKTDISGDENRVYYDVKGNSGRTVWFNGLDAKITGNKNNIDVKSTSDNRYTTAKVNGSENTISRTNSNEVLLRADAVYDVSGSKNSLILSNMGAVTQNVKITGNSNSINAAHLSIMDNAGQGRNNTLNVTQEGDRNYVSAGYVGRTPQVGFNNALDAGLNKNYLISQRGSGNSVESISGIYASQNGNSNSVYLGSNSQSSRAASGIIGSIISSNYVAQSGNGNKVIGAGRHQLAASQNGDENELNLNIFNQSGASSHPISYSLINQTGNRNKASIDGDIANGYIRNSVNQYGDNNTANVSRDVNITQRGINNTKGNSNSAYVRSVNLSNRPSSQINVAQEGNRNYARARFSGDNPGSIFQRGDDNSVDISSEIQAKDGIPSVIRQEGSRNIINANHLYSAPISSYLQRGNNNSATFAGHVERFKQEGDNNIAVDGFIGSKIEQVGNNNKYDLVNVTNPFYHYPSDIVFGGDAIAGDVKQMGDGNQIIKSTFSGVVRPDGYYQYLYESTGVSDLKVEQNGSYNHVNLVYGQAVGGFFRDSKVDAKQTGNANANVIFAGDKSSITTEQIGDRNQVHVYNYGSEHSLNTKQTGNGNYMLATFPFGSGHGNYRLEQNGNNNHLVANLTSNTDSYVQNGNNNRATITK